MSQSSPLDRLAKLLEHVGWSADDSRSVRQCWPYIAPHADEIVDDFYQAIQKNPMTQRVITGGMPQIQRLKQSLKDWIRQVINSEINADYLVSRQMLGKRHVDVGVSQQITIAAMARLRAQLFRCVRESATSREEKWSAVVALSKRMDLDLALIDEAYHTEYMRRQIPVNQSRIRQQRAVVELGQRALEVSELAPLFEFAVVVLADALAADQCAVLEWRESSDELIVRTAFGLELPTAGEFAIPAHGEHWPAQVLHQRQLLAVSDENMQQAPWMPRLPGRERVASIAGVPLWGEKRLWGVLLVQSCQPRDFVPGDQDCLQAMANILSAGIGRKQTEWRMIHAERLAGIGQMIAGIAHESRNALQRIQAATEILRIEVAHSPQAVPLLERIERAQRDITRLFDEVRGYAAPLALSKEPTDLRHIWRMAWAELVPFHAGRSLVLDDSPVDGMDVMARVDGFRMKQVFRNLFENSLAAAKQDVLVTIDLAREDVRSQNQMRIRVRDNGPGFSTEALVRAFDPFYTTRTKGTGLGLAITHRIVEAHGGSIHVVASDTPGAQVEIILPRS